MPGSPAALVVFLLGNRQYALALSAVERVVRMVDITPLPHAPAIVSGVINMQGRIIPVVDPRRLFRLPERAVELSDMLVIARAARRTVALVVDRVSDVLQYAAQEVLGLQDILPGSEGVMGVVTLHDGLVLIYDLDRFLSLDEDHALNAALEAI